MRVLIVPMYLFWMVITMLLVALFGPQGPPGFLGLIISGLSFVLGFTPYVLADYVLHRWRQSAARKVP